MSISEAWESLETAMIGDDDPDYDTEPEPIPAHDLDRANRMLLHLARIDRERANVEQVAEAQISQVNAWLASQQERLDARRAWCAGALEGFHRAVLAAEPGRKSIALPSGTLKARKLPARWEADPQAVLAWARANGHPEIIRVVPAREELDKVAMKAALIVTDEKGQLLALGVDPATGEQVPGLAVHAGEVAFTATPEGAE